MKQRKSNQSRLLLPEARVLVLPDGIVSTDAPRMIETARRCGLQLDDWQQDIASILFARQADGSYAADTIGISIARQAGKTYLISALMIALCLVEPKTTVMWTAHHTSVMLETFRHMRTTIGIKAIALHVLAVRSSNADRSIIFRNGSRIVMRSREAGAARGLDNVSVLVLDEAQILSEDAMADILPTQNAAKKALTIMMGTPPRPKDPGDVFTEQRENALTVTSGKQPPELAAWIEFAADSDADTDDLKQLRLANPSYPKRTPLRAIRKLRRSLSEDNFRREALGIWDANNTPLVIPQSVWDSCEDPDSVGVERLVLGVDVSPNRQEAAISVAALREDGLVHVELIATSGSILPNGVPLNVGWIPDWLAERARANRLAGIVVDARSPAATLLPELKARRLKVTVTGTDDMADACAGFYDSCVEGTLRHIGQPQLTVAMQNARKRTISGDRWAWNRKSSDSDITPIVSATLAVWGVRSRKVKGGRPVRMVFT
ncbi:MAG: terminase family protein [Actinomycetaceae bacterium]|nr:terminase large subunit [Actinomycetaceae bacterium]MDY6082575.1 terminase family protein [Actinomycetaceae bacterium]